MNARHVVLWCSLSLALLGACETERFDAPPRDEASTPPAGEVVPVSLPPTTFAPQAQLAEPYANAAAGRDVDLDGDAAIVSTDQERAFVYRRTAGIWGEAAVLTKSLGAADLGDAVAIEGDLAVLGAPGYGDGIPANYGAIVVFEHSGGVWSEAQQIDAPIVSSSYNFGRAVAIEGGRIFVGAPNDDVMGTNAGAIYVLADDPIDGWEIAFEIRPADIGPDDQFGRHIDIDGDRLVVGVPADDEQATNAGAVYVVDVVGTSWTAERLTAATFAADNLGASVAVAGDTIFAGAPNYGASGAAFVFEKSGAVWSSTMLTVPAAVNAQLGVAVALDPPWALVSAYHDTVNQDGDGTVHVFGHDGTGWQARHELTGSPLPNQGIFWHEFGWSVALEGDTALVGWPGDPDPMGKYGSVWAFAAVGTTCSQPSDCPASLCIDGYCCNAMCDGPCDRCDVSGAEGICSPAAGDSGEPSCAPFVCDGSGPDCPTSCTQNNQCDGEHYCNADQCLPKADDGAACTIAAQCQSGFCVDGVCCGGPCGSQCEACDAAGSLGTCTVITGAPHGERTPCVADSCSDGVEAVGSICAGELTCAPPTQSACAPYACGESACRTSCTLPEHCLEGYVCDFDSNTCLGDAAICEGDVLHQPDGSTTHCAPYRCSAAGACLTACTFSGDCAGGHVCASNGACVEAPAFAADDGGCSLPGGSGRGHGSWLIFALVALAARRRRP